jgi:endonuclease/exonuclease/phosphatase (EEP) superfamily protein YafD
MPKHSLSRLIHDLTWILKAVIIDLFIVTTFPFFHLDGYLFEIISHFPLQYFTIGLIGIIIFFKHRAFFFLILSAFVFLGNGYILSDYPLFASAKVTTETNPKVLLANVLTSNTHYEEFVSLIKSKKPNVVIVLEANREWVKALDPLNEIYPYRTGVAREDNFGIILLSNLPLINSDSEPLAVGETLSVKTDFQIGNKVVTVIGVHTLPPISSSYYDLRNHQLQSIASIARKNNLPTIVLGDLNTTIWAMSFQRFLAQSGLTNPRRNFGIIPTWPTHLPMLYIPIDHILTSKSVDVVNLESVPIVGSDHRGLIAELVIE